MSYSIDEHDGRAVEREKDDMASRRVSNHIPAPLRKKKYEESYKKFITPVGNPAAALQKHMRSKSLSDLNAEKKEEENQRAEINSRYDEMEKLKGMLKEDEDSWKSKLASWKNRRRSVTEEARRRKEERDHLEREAEEKALRRKTKTYKEIVEDKRRRDRELADLNDQDEYEFVSPRSSEADRPVRIIEKKSLKKAESAQSSQSSSDDDTFSAPSKTQKSSHSMRNVDAMLNPPRKVDTSYNSPRKVDTMLDPPRKVDTTFNSPRKVDTIANSPRQADTMLYSPRKADTLDSKIEYKYTTKVTAQIGQPTTPAKDMPQQKIAVAVPASGSQAQNEYRGKYEKHNGINPAVEQSSNVPKVLLRSKGRPTMKERPKSAHELFQGSSTLPRNYMYNPNPKPFVPGETDFKKYRKTNFANRMNMWENLGSSTETRPVQKQYSEDAIPKSQQSQKIVGPLNLSRETVPKPHQPKKIVAPQNLNRETVPKPHQPKKIVAPQNLSRENPSLVPAVSRATQKPLQATSQQIPVAYPTAKLSASGLTMVSPRVSKRQAQPTVTGELFDDMKICINQRPRSEKGFGFTVRGGDDGKPVIVDTVSAGGAADICQLCVSDEILAINDVPLADCKTQDDIVQLIVSSVITGHLSLNIRRYGKAKKTSSLGLSGTKVVMTPAGFVQVRSDRPSSAASSPSPARKIVPAFRDDNNNNDNDFPPPPSWEELDATRQSPRHGQNLTSGVFTNRNVEENEEIAELEEDVFKTKNALDFEQKQLEKNDVRRKWTVSDRNVKENEEMVEMEEDVLITQSPPDFEQKKMEKNELRRKWMEEQKRLERDEAQREIERKKLQEEAILEDERVAEELRRIQARSQRQSEERRALQQQQQQQRTQNPFPRPYSASNNRGRGGMHWLVEEAERQREAESTGRLRMNVLSQSKKMDAGANSLLPPHVIQHLTQRSNKAMGQSS